jgi:hypothetical protein
MTLDERKTALRDYLTRTRAELRGLLENLPAADWDRVVQSVEGGWTVKQALLHLWTSETGQTATGRAIAAGQPTVPDDFDLNRYNNRQVEKNRDRSPQEVLAAMLDSRQQLLAFLDEVSEADLARRGRHARGDVLTLEQLFHRIAEHEAEHTAEIKAALGRG